MRVECLEKGTRGVSAELLLLIEGHRLTSEDSKKNVSWRLAGKNEKVTGRETQID